MPALSMAAVGRSAPGLALFTIPTGVSNGLRHREAVDQANGSPRNRLPPRRPHARRWVGRYALRNRPILIKAIETDETDEKRPRCCRFPPSD
jgi:hypothetical protein